MYNKNPIKGADKDIEGRYQCEWFEMEQKMKLGLALPNDKDFFNEDICNLLINTDPDLKRIKATTFDYWTSTYTLSSEQRGYVQTHKGKRIIDTRLIFQIEESHRKRRNEQLYELGGEEGSSNAIIPADKVGGRQIAHVNFIYKRLIRNPIHDRKAKLVDDRIIEQMVDEEVVAYGRLEGIDQAERNETHAKRDVLVPESYDFCNGTPAVLHAGLVACVGTSYFTHNEFPQSLWFIIDMEKGEVVYTKTLPVGGVVHSTRIDQTEIESRPTTIDRRNLRFAGTKSKLRPGQISGMFR